MCNKRLLEFSQRHVQNIKEHELVAGGGGFYLFKAVQRDDLLADEVHRVCKVAIARDLTKAGEAAGI